MNLFKLKAPKENQQEFTELESWTISWEVKTGWSNNTEIYSKVLIKESEADEFKKQLEESAKFIKAWINTSKKKN